MSGKSYELYSMMLTQLKKAAADANLTLKPLVIHCDFKESPDMGYLGNLNLEKFVTYFEDKWIKENFHFDRSVWNLFDVYSSRTNNISETYNHSINDQVNS